MCRRFDSVHHHFKSRFAGFFVLSNSNMYISITGLTPKSPFHVILFWFHAIRSFRQAQQAPGNLYCATRKINGVYHTITAWESKNQMLAFIHQEPHINAIKAFNKIATGKTFGFESETIPNWLEAQKVWEEKGKVY